MAQAAASDAGGAWLILDFLAGNNDMRYVFLYCELCRRGFAGPSAQQGCTAGPSSPAANYTTRATKHHRPSATCQTFPCPLHMKKQTVTWYYHAMPCFISFSLPMTSTLLISPHHSPAARESAAQSSLNRRFLFLSFCILSTSRAWPMTSRDISL